MFRVEGFGFKVSEAKLLLLGGSGRQYWVLAREQSSSKLCSSGSVAAKLASFLK